MSKTSSIIGAGGCALVLLASLPAVAQTAGLPEVEFTTRSVAAGLTGAKGSGVLKLPALGRGCQYRFTIDGIGAGVKVGVSRVTASGFVQNMTKVADFPGGYRKSDMVATLIRGKGVMTLVNQRNKVRMELKSKTRGLELGAGDAGMTISLTDPIPQGARTFFIFFGFNKTHVSKGSKAILDAVAAAWKCRYAKIKVVGHTDTVGKENYNLDLSGRRALAVQNYLVEAGGITANRISTRAAGEKELISETGKGVRRRSNRAAVITIE